MLGMLLDAGMPPTLTATRKRVLAGRRLSPAQSETPVVRGRHVAGTLVASPVVFPGFVCSTTTRSRSIMKRFKLTGVVLLAVFAFSAIVATAAQAEEAPYWSIEGTRLATGKTAETTAKAVGTQTLTAGKVKVTCKVFKLKPGAVILGSNAGEPGKSDETIEYSGCSVSGNGTGCKVVGSAVTTEPLTNELAYAENKKSLVVEFTPVSKSTLAVLKFEGTCTVAETSVKGVAVAQAWTDSGGVAGELLTLPNTVAQAESFVLKLPGVAKNKIWLIKGGTGASVEDETTAFGGEASLGGEALIKLASGKLWSPLL
jgi:hypothetical protein